VTRRRRTGLVTLDLWNGPTPILRTDPEAAPLAPAPAVAEATVKTHVGHIMAKLGSRDRIQAVVYAYEIGLITPRGRS
jgi:hypothetical protein